MPTWPQAWRGTPTPDEQYQAQDKEDQFAYEHFFFNTVGGTYLEVGGLNGVLFSNTLWYHRTLGWRGVLIEADPASYAELIVNRPSDVNVNAALCEKEQQVHWISGDTPAVRGIWELMTDRFKAHWYPGLTDEEAKKRTVITCTPLTSVLSVLRLAHIDFFILDVEGGELAVLQSINLDCVTFGVIAVEADGGNPEKDKGVIDLLTKHGYVYYGHVLRNDWFVHSGFQASLKPGVKPLVQPPQQPSNR